jgi:hypothetical protein
MFEGKVIGLWEVKGYTNKPNRINKNDPGVVEFDEVSSFPSVHVAQLIRNPAFSFLKQLSLLGVVGSLKLRLMKKIHPSTLLK